MIWTTDRDGNEWVVDEKGNCCSLAYWGSTEKAEAALGSNTYCSRCSDCSRCSGCSRCSDALLALLLGLLGLLALLALLVLLGLLGQKRRERARANRYPCH